MTGKHVAAIILTALSLAIISYSLYSMIALEREGRLPFIAIGVMTALMAIIVLRVGEPGAKD